MTEASYQLPNAAFATGMGVIYLTGPTSTSEDHRDTMATVHTAIHLDVKTKDGLCVLGWMDRAKVDEFLKDQEYESFQLDGNLPYYVSIKTSGMPKVEVGCDPAGVENVIRMLNPVITAMPSLADRPHTESLCLYPGDPVALAVGGHGPVPPKEDWLWSGPYFNFITERLIQLNTTKFVLGVVPALTEERVEELRVEIIPPIAGVKVGPILGNIETLRGALSFLVDTCEPVDKDGCPISEAHQLLSTAQRIVVGALNRSILKFSPGFRITVQYANNGEDWTEIKLTMQIDGCTHIYHLDREFNYIYDHRRMQKVFGT